MEYKVFTETKGNARIPYEIVKEVSPKVLLVRELGHKKADKIPMSNNWRLYIEELNPIKELVYRNGVWKFATKFTKEDLDKVIIIDKKIRAKVEKDGVAYEYTKANIEFGYAEYYFDYEV